MGLDVTAFKSVRYAHPHHDPCDENDCVHLYPNPAFLAQSDGMLDGHFIADGESFHFRAGSYSGYNAWRRELALAMLGVPPQAVWENPSGFAGKPFVELVNYSDCEGVIGPRTSAKLARDFADNRARAEAYAAEHDTDGWWLKKYDDWSKAFTLAASEGGCVELH